VLWEAMNEHDRRAVLWTRVGDVNRQATGRPDVLVLDASQLRREI
jgi:hypothetical protein